MKYFHLFLFVLVSLLFSAGMYGLISYRVQGMKLSSPDKILSYLKKGLYTCNIQSNKYCYERFATEAYGKTDFKKILQVLENNGTDKDLSKGCHLFLHYLGHEIYKDAKSLPKGLAECSNFCVDGCYHGVAEEFVKEKYNGNMDLMRKNINKDIAMNCPGPEKCDDAMTYLVAHGLGHAFMDWMNFDLNKSLTLCDLLDQNIRNSCYYGSFMDFSQNLNSTDHPINDPGRNNPLYPCNILDQKYLRLCYITLVERKFQYQTSMDDRIRFCNTVPNEYTAECYARIAIRNSTQTMDIGAMKKDCESIPNPEYAGTCIRKVITDLSKRFPADNPLLNNFCMILNGIHKTECFDQITKEQLHLNTLN